MSETNENIEPEVQTPSPDAPVSESPDAPVPESADGPVVVESEPEAPESADAPTPIDMGVLEALLFSTRSPLTAQRLADLMEIPSVKPLKKAIKTLNEQYEQSQRCFRVEQVAGGYQLLTLPLYGPHLDKLYKRDADAKLTKSALETLAIIAYKQPILRAQVEAIRGVACGETIRSLMEKHLVRIAGRAEEPGRPILYGTTKRFLEVFGLNTLKDLPQSQQLVETGAPVVREKPVEVSEKPAEEAVAAEVVKPEETAPEPAAVVENNPPSTETVEAPNEQPQ